MLGDGPGGLGIQSVLTGPVDHGQDVGVTLGGSQERELSDLLLAGSASPADLGVGLGGGGGVLATGDARKVTAGDAGSSGDRSLALPGSLDKALEQLAVVASHNSIITDY